MESVTQPPSTPDILPTPTPPPPTGFPKILLLVLLILFIFFLGATATYIYLSPKSNTTEKVTQVQESIPTSSISPTIQPRGINNRTLGYDSLYIRDSNIYWFDMEKSQEKQLTSDGGRLITYRQPLWGGEDEFSFIRCQREGEDDLGKNSCQIIRKSLDSATSEVLVSVSSQPNNSGYQEGGYISLHRVNRAKNVLAYTSQIGTPDTDDFGLSELHILTLTDKNDITLSTFDAGGGRGGILDDDSSLYFSPDGGKILLIDTGLYPHFMGKDRGTMFVYDVSSGKLLWEKAQTWSTFGRWLDSDTVIVKQIDSSTDKPTIPIIVKINTANNTLEKIIDIDRDYGFEPIDGKSVVYYTVKSSPETGITIKKIDITSKAVTVVRDNLLKVKVLPDGRMIVRTMKACSNESEAEYICGIDLFNGYTEDALAIFDGENIAELNLPIPKPYSIFNIDVR